MPQRGDQALRVYLTQLRLDLLAWHLCSREAVRSSNLWMAVSTRVLLVHKPNSLPCSIFSSSYHTWDIFRVLECESRKEWQRSTSPTSSFYTRKWQLHSRLSLALLLAWQGLQRRGKWRMFLFSHILWKAKVMVSPSPQPARHANNSLNYFHSAYKAMAFCCWGKNKTLASQQ